MSEGSQATATKPPSYPQTAGEDHGGEERATTTQRKTRFEETQSLNAYLREHNERMHTWRALQKEWM